MKDFLNNEQTPIGTLGGAMVRIRFSQSVEYLCYLSGRIYHARFTEYEPTSGGAGGGLHS